jgi:hypothetical protein
MRGRTSVVVIGAVASGLTGMVCLLASPSWFSRNLLSRTDDTPEQVLIVPPNVSDYDYSGAMRTAGFVVWDDAKLARFIAKPDEVVPGNKMKPYEGLTFTSADDAKKLVAFRGEDRRGWRDVCDGRLLRCATQIEPRVPAR